MVKYFFPMGLGLLLLFGCSTKGPKALKQQIDRNKLHYRSFKHSNLFTYKKGNKTLLTATLYDLKQSKKRFILSLIDEDGLLNTMPKVTLCNQKPHISVLSKEDVVVRQFPLTNKWERYYLLELINTPPDACMFHIEIDGVATAPKRIYLKPKYTFRK